MQWSLGIETISLRRIRQSRITKNIIALYGTQIAAYVFPLATVPYLARVLGPHHLGLVAFAQAMGLYLSIVVEFGFQLSASRQIARHRENPRTLEQILAGVMGAKLLLATLCLIVVIVVQCFLASFRGYGLILWAGALSGIGQGFSMLWFYQGMERMRTSAIADVVAKAASAAGVFLFVHQRPDAWKVLALQCGCFCAGSLVLLVMTYREIRFRWPTPIGTWQAMKESAGMFLFRSAVSLYTTANALILGAVAPPSAVGFYSGPEKLTKACLNLLNPLSNSLYPRLSRLMTQDRAKAIVLARISLGIMVLGGVCLFATIFIAAPLIVRVVLGPGYEPAVPVIRILSLLLPPIAVSNVLGIQWMLPLGMDAVFNKIIIAAGLINLALAMWWAERWQEIGMAWAVVTSESFVVIAMCGSLLRNRVNPLSERSALELRIAEQIKVLEV